VPVLREERVADTADALRNRTAKGIHVQTGKAAGDEWGYREAAGVDSAMKHQKGRAAAKIGALYSAGAGSLLDLVRVGARAAGKGGRIPMLSPWLAARLESRGLLIWEGAGGFAAGSGMIVLGLIDLKNAYEAKGRDQYGLVALYRVNAVAEISVGGSTVLNGISIIARGTLLFPGIGPVARNSRRKCCDRIRKGHSRDGLGSSMPMGQRKQLFKRGGRVG
jgi:hypothetical protein